MHGLRWVLGIVACLYMAGWVALFLLVGKFRESFTGSPGSATKLVVPLAMAVLILISVLNPGQRPLLHVTAVVVAGLSVASLWIVRAAPVMVSLWLVYAVLWAIYYVNSVRAPAIP